MATEHIAEHLNIQLILLLTVGFASASILGYLAHRLHVSPILGYLVAGYLIGPFSPGFVADLKIAEQLAEIGVILMMFSVGMHFTWDDLVKVKKVAIPGAFLQTFTAAFLGMLLFMVMGQTMQAGIIFGLCIGVASTVVLIRGLTENHLLNTSQGHLCVGWLILEDKITVVALLLLPTFAVTPIGQGLLLSSVLGSFALIFAKFFLLVFLLFTVGKRLAKIILEKVVKTGSQELFTITVLALAFVFAEVANLVFGMSIVIGAFLAGIAIGQTDVRHEVTQNIRPIKEAFIVLFFLAMGMIFDPKAIYEHFVLFVATLAIILLAKPLSAYVLAKGFGRTSREAITVAVALAQIGEFSFILAEEANRFKILPDFGYDVLVACALVSISLNPFLFKWARTRYETV